MKQSAIARLFGESPFPNLKEHMLKVKNCLDNILPMMEAYADTRYDIAKEHARQIMKIEHEADEIKKELRDHLPKSIFLPVDRRDLLEFISAQDSISDVCEDLAVLLTLRKTALHPGMRDALFIYLKKSLEAAYQSVDIISELDSMLETSFGGKEAERVVEMIDNVSVLEWEADKKQYKLAQHLFELEKEIGPVDLMMWFEVTWQWLPVERESAGGGQALLSKD